MQRSSPLLAALGALTVATSFSWAVAISPELHPESSDEFFGRDYPSDQRPVADKKYYKFHHPYPIVQEDHDYDTDFIKDENNDHGEWDAQMKYDSLRNKIRSQKALVEESFKNMQENKKVLESAETAERDAEAARKQADQATAEAKKLADDADDDVKHLAGSGEGGSDGLIGDAVRKVEQEMSDLEKCKAELEEARAALKKAMEEKSNHDAKHLRAKAAVKEKRRIAKETREKQGEKYSQEKATAEEWNEDQDETVEELEADMNDVKKDYTGASEKYAKEKWEAKKTEEDLEKAADKLRKYRHAGHTDDKGGSAPLSTMLAVVVAVVSLLPIV